jgi:hypothetical protein
VIQVTSIQNTPDQNFRLALADGSLVVVHLVFRPRVTAWFADITWGTFQLNGLKLANTLNSLAQYRRLPFGLFIYVPDGTEPFLIDDFTTGRCSFFILEQSDLDLIAAAAGGIGLT